MAPHKDIDYDITIVGGGLVGLAAALSLAGENCLVHLLEAGEPEKIMANRHPSFDDRTLVINPASRLFWQQLNLWKDLLPHCTAVNRVHVSQKGRFGSVRFDRERLQVDYLAHVIEAKVLGRCLWLQVMRHPHITLSAPAELTEFSSGDQDVLIHYKSLSKSNSHRSKLLLAADGARSAVRQKLGLKTITKNYHRTAIVANVMTELPHRHCAYERLTNTGPMALLPFHDRLGLIWSLPEVQAQQLLKLGDSEFTQGLQEAIGYRLGRLSRIGKRSAYPLYRICVPQQFKQRVLLLGNAAHTVSPVSAQGLNLGVRGIQRLTAVIKKALKTQQDIGSDGVLSEYQRQSQPDQQAILQYTDDLMTWFKIDQPLVNGLRALGLLAVDSSVGLQRQFYRLAGGLAEMTS
ncbi:MAG: FAD-dependent monooxygenase [Marinicella pacifica]